MAQGKKLFVSLVVWNLIDLERLPKKHQFSEVMGKMREV